MLIDELDNMTFGSEAERDYLAVDKKFIASKLPALKLGHKNGGTMLSKSPSYKSTLTNTVISDSMKQSRNSQSIYRSSSKQTMAISVKGADSHQMKNIFAHKRHTSSGVYLTDLQSSTQNSSDQERQLRNRRNKSAMKFDDPMGPELMIKENAVDEAMGTYHSISPWVDSS